MKGQYFLTGTFVLLAIIFIAVPFSATVGSTKSYDFSFISENIEKEFSHALNLGINKGSIEETMDEFSEFVQTTLKEKATNAKIFWLVSVSDEESSEMDLIAGNYMGNQETVSFQIGGDNREFVLSDGSSRKESFVSVSSDPEIDVSFGKIGKMLSWKRDKINLYVYLRLSRGNDVSIKEFEA